MPLFADDISYIEKPKDSTKQLLDLTNKVKSESEVVQSCPTLRDPMDCSLPGSSVQGIFQARVMEWGAIAFSALQDEKGKNQAMPSGH